MAPASTASSHVVLMGDAVHTAHFAIGSGTKLALEDAIELTRLFKDRGRPGDIGGVLADYQASAPVDVLRLQNAAWNAMEWFEVVGSAIATSSPPEQFMYSMLTRSQRISHENLRLRDAAGWKGYERWFAQQAGVPWPTRRRRQPDVHALHAARGMT
jgi:anthraniloyl-CoA monooxygenase